MMKQSQVCKECGYINYTSRTLCIQCGTNLTPNQSINEDNQLDSYKEILFQRKTTISADGLFKSKNTDETIYNILEYSSGTTVFLLIFGTAFLFTFSSLFSPYHSINNVFISSLAISLIYFILVLLTGSEYVYIKSDRDKVIGKIRTKNLIRRKKYVSPDFFTKNILKLEFLSNQQANFYINEEKYKLFISRKEKTLLKVLDTNNNIIIQVINPDVSKYPITLNVLFKEQIDQRIAVFLISSVMEKLLVNKKGHAIDHFIRTAS